MFPTIAPPVDRSTRTAQTQAFQGNVIASDTACTVCCVAAGLLPFPANIAAKLACRAISGCSC